MIDGRNRTWREAMTTATLAIAAPCPMSAGAGGLLLYEFGTAELASRRLAMPRAAQDAIVRVPLNPAGMTRLDVTQVLSGGQVMWLNRVLDRR